MSDSATSTSTVAQLIAVTLTFLLLLPSGVANYNSNSKSDLHRRYFGPRMPPIFVNSGGKTIKVTVGDTVTIPCKIHNKGDATVVWKLGDRVIYADRVHIGKDLRASIIDNTSLVLTGVDTQYTGNYTCEVEWSPEKAPLSLSHYLEVCVPPSVVAVKTEGGGFVDVKEGDNATLECEADGIPRPLIHWMSNRWGSNRQEKGSKLNLSNTKRTDTGQYTCVASNGIGQPATSQITLRVQYAPLVSAVPPRVSCLAGYRVALTCSVLSVPKPDVQWFFNRRQLKMDAKHTMEERGDNYTLTVANVRQQDLGEYTCSAVNKIGEAQASVLLTGTPFGLEIKSSSRGLYKHTYNLTWTMKSFVTLEETEISYRRKGMGMGMWMKQSLDHRPPQPSWNDNRDHFNFGDVVGNLADEETHLSGFQHQPSTSEDTFRFDNLSPDTEYEVKIKARNSYGWSDNEPHFVFKTSHRDPEPQRMSTFSDGISEWRSTHATSIKNLCITTFVIMVVAT